MKPFFIGVALGLAILYGLLILIEYTGPFCCAALNQGIVR